MMRYLLIYLVLLGLVSAVFSVYFALENESVRDGCLDYIKPGKNHITGNPDTEIDYREVFAYDFDFYLNPIKAQTDELYIEIGRIGYFNTLLSCVGPYGVLSEINGFRAIGDKGENTLRLYPSEQLSTGRNSFFLVNTSEKTYCSGAGCPKGTIEKPGLCIFRVCGFYPDLKIATTVAPDSIYHDESFSMEITIVNEDEVDAGSVKAGVIQTDFSVSPEFTSGVILAKSEEPFNELHYILNFSPKKYVEIETGLNSVAKRIGHFAVAFNDVDGRERVYQKDLGSIIVLKKTDKLENESIPHSKQSEEYLAHVGSKSKQEDTTNQQVSNDRVTVCPLWIAILFLIFLCFHMDTK